MVDTWKGFEIVYHIGHAGSVIAQAWRAGRLQLEAVGIDKAAAWRKLKNRIEARVSA